MGYWLAGLSVGLPPFTAAAVQCLPKYSNLNITADVTAGRQPACSVPTVLVNYVLRHLLLLHWPVAVLHLVLYHGMPEQLELKMHAHALSVPAGKFSCVL